MESKGENKVSDSILPFINRSLRLSLIDRCSNTPHVNPYPVASHSYYVALFAMMFADIENERLRNDLERMHPLYDTSEVIKRALLHDLEESETGDILFPVHNMSPPLRRQLEKVRVYVVDNIVFEELPSEVRKYYIRLWRTSKDETMEGVLIAAMDKFEILVFATREIDMGNTLFREVYESAKKILKRDFKIPSVLDTVFEIESIYG